MPATTPSRFGAPQVRAGAVVVGGGVVGTSIAYRLAEAGVRDVVVLEAGELGGGSSGKPLGGVRAYFSDPANVELGHRSLASFRAFGDGFGVDVGLREVGYLFAIRDAADVPGFEAGIEVQRLLGVTSHLVGAEEALRLCPYLDAEALVAAAWSPADGFARPGAVVAGYANAARALGATVRTGAEVVAIDAASGAATVVVADGSRYVTPVVVCAAGAWSAAVGAMAGVDLPVVPVRREIAFTGPLPRPAPPDVPFTIDYSSTAYFHGAGDGGLLLGWADPAQAEGFGRDVSTGWHAGLREALGRFAPSLAGAPLRDGWAGLYEQTPDRNGLVGEADPGFRFLYATGFSGHGFLQAPAVGECVRDLVLGREPVVDVACFDAARFAAPARRTELGII